MSLNEEVRFNLYEIKTMVHVYIGKVSWQFKVLSMTFKRNVEVALLQKKKQFLNVLWGNMLVYITITFCIKTSLIDATFCIVYSGHQ